MFQLIYYRYRSLRGLDMKKTLFVNLTKRTLKKVTKTFDTKLKGVEHYIQIQVSPPAEGKHS